MLMCDLVVFPTNIDLQLKVYSYLYTQTVSGKSCFLNQCYTLLYFSRIQTDCSTFTFKTDRLCQLGTTEVQFADFTDTTTKNNVFPLKCLSGRQYVTT